MGASEPIRLDGTRERESLQMLSLLLQQQKGICLFDYKDRLLERRLRSRVRATGCADIRAYVEYLRQNSGEVERLLDSLAINISGFFRDPDVFRAIASVVFEGWRKSGLFRERKVFRAWSCACAHGEEPYSLSALWEQWIQRKSGKPVPELRITASDVDSEALTRARTAHYDATAISGIPDQYSSFFETRGGRLIIPASIRSRIRFVQENVLIPAHRRRSDLVLCRNFLMFFDRGARENAMKMLEDSVEPGGYLVLGGAETFKESPGRKLVPVDSAHRIYQKKAG